MVPHPIDEFLTLVPVIPVIVIDRVEQAQPLARALVAGGLRVLEVTLRTPAAIEAIRAMADVEGAIVGAGTILEPAQLEVVEGAGARFAVSPGYTPALANAARNGNMPWLPGVATATEAMAARADGLRRLKFFPAESAGGIGALKALASVFPDLKFCPTGGIGAANAGQYLSLPNVVCVGGSWVVPADALASADWSRVQKLAAEASRLRGAPA